MKKITFLFILTLPFCVFANGDKVIINESSGALSIEPNSLSHLGISISLTREVEAPVLPVAPPTISEQQRPVTPQRREEMRQALAEATPATGPEAAPETETEAEAETETRNPQLSNFNNNGAQPMSQGASTNSFNAPTAPTSSSRPTVIGGVPYRVDNDEDNDNKDKTTQIINISKTEPVHNDPFTSNSSKTKKESRKRGSEKGSNNPVAGASTNGSFGDFQSSGGNNSRRNRGRSQRGSGVASQALSKLKGQEGRYFGSSGGRRSARRGRYGRRSSRSKGRRLASVRGGGSRSQQDPRQLLQSRLSRGLASANELADKNTFLFSSMCRHYDRYEKKHEINFGRTQCPKP